MSFSERLFIRLPDLVQRAAIALYGRHIQGRRFGADFKRVFARSEARLGWSAGQLQDYRARRLSEHFKFARHSPFWAESFAAHGVNVDASDPFAELAKLPILTKEELRVHAHRIQNPLFDRTKLVDVTTSGTTGAGLSFGETRESEWERWSVWWRYRRKLGIEFDTPCGHFGGRVIVPPARSKPPYWRSSPFARQVIFSPYHLTESTVRDYVAELDRSKIEWIHGYPSTLLILSALIREAGIAPPARLRVVTTGAENLSEQQRTVIAGALGVPVFEHYGLAESTANFSQEPSGHIYVDEDFSAVETVPVVASSQHSIVGTNWHNPAFPLFRYDCGDLCTPAGRQADPSGGMRSREILAIDGRQDDVLTLSNGVQVGRLDHIFKHMVNVRAAQILQTTPGEAVFYVVKGADFGESDEKLLLREIDARIGHYCRFYIVYKDEIPRTHSGKLRLVVSRLNPSPKD